ncbi:hypothetical protein A3844_13065 [Paenibacillus helianthi]|uniref:Uncharacterized protein n=1 Tax=Paenibacillus helianthi TaxID=1349432 RepID=A0ABX3EN01_9BACL|nr:hypothetical protein A3842_17460 [Paenibacillus sp. P3E]OKP86468.1 hypothetical protein A3844_13065 [Paenibacillus helianthi]
MLVLYSYIDRTWELDHEIRESLVEKGSLIQLIWLMKCPMWEKVSLILLKTPYGMIKHELGVQNPTKTFCHRVPAHLVILIPLRFSP